eukprot:3208595-Pyramimonas_sp.AAC.1
MARAPPQPRLRDVCNILGPKRALAKHGNDAARPSAVPCTSPPRTWARSRHPRTPAAKRRCHHQRPPAWST